MATSVKTQLEKIHTFLAKGGRLTTSVARKKLGVRNLSARIFELRNNGWEIYTNSRYVKGRKNTHYRLDNSQQF